MRNRNLPIRPSSISRPLPLHRRHQKNSQIRRTRTTRHLHLHRHRRTKRNNPLHHISHRSSHHDPPKKENPNEPKTPNRFTRQTHQNNQNPNNTTHKTMNQHTKNQQHTTTNKPTPRPTITHEDALTATQLEICPWCCGKAKKAPKGPHRKCHDCNARWTETPYGGIIEAQ